MPTLRVRLLSFLLLVAVPATQADEQLRAAQEELRRRNIYFGEIDGRETKELGEAMRRYQKRKGFTATGRPDTGTLRSLGLLGRDPDAPKPKELPLPDEPVLKSDVKILPAAEAKALSRETGVALAALGPVAEKTSTSSRSREASKPERLAPAPETRGTKLRTTAGTTVAQRLDPANLAPLVRGYLKASSGNDVREEIRYLADKVDYLGHGLMDWRVVERTLRSYYQRWPDHSYSLAGPIQYRRDAGRGQVVAICTVKFELGRGRTKAKGIAQNRIVFDAATTDPRIVSIKEQRVRQ